MERIWQWVWDRFGTRYSWVFCAITLLLSIYLLWSFLVVNFEASRDYVETAVITVVAVLVLAYLTVLPGRAWSRLAEQWAAGQVVDRAKAVEATYMWSRGAAARAVAVNAVGVALLLIVAGAIAGAGLLRLVQY